MSNIAKRDFIADADLANACRLYRNSDRSLKLSRVFYSFSAALFAAAIVNLFFLMHRSPAGKQLLLPVSLAAAFISAALLPLFWLLRRRHERERNDIVRQFFDIGLHIDRQGNLVSKEIHPQHFASLRRDDWKYYDRLESRKNQVDRRSDQRKAFDRRVQHGLTALSRVSAKAQVGTLRDRVTGVFVQAAAPALICMTAGLIMMSALPMDSLAQIVCVVVLLGVMTYARVAASSAPGGIFHVMTLTIGAVISLRYLIWRGSYTLFGGELVGVIGSIVLYIAEVYSTGLHLLGCMVNALPLDRPVLRLKHLPPDTPLPTVDVLVPSYNESAGLLEVTLRAALFMHYPAQLLSVHLLDDGGTDQKVNDPDPIKSSEARMRRATLQALCDKLGVHYWTREKNLNAKAGNLNSALRHVTSDLVVILDADHVPTMEFLDYTVPWFVLHDDVFLVQTPHFMINPDPIERNLLRSFRRMPSENDMFYQIIQRGLDFWSSSFFCGSAAVLRRRHLDEVGGIQGISITEDAETALELHQKGYRSIYINRPLVAGLAPETFAGFIIQRMRWAQGMTQIMLLKRPFLQPGLRWYQRIGYMSSLMYWLFPFARIAFLVGPVGYLVFGLQLYKASLPEIIGYTVPHVVATYMVSSLLFGRARWPLVSELYEVSQCLFSLKAIVEVLRNPRKPSFMVTPKGESLMRDFISPLARPSYILAGVVFIGFIGGIWRYEIYPQRRDLTIVVLLWNLFNFYTIIAALGALRETKQNRSESRMPANDKGALELGNEVVVQCEIDDLSAGGARVLVPNGSAALSVGDRFTLRVYVVPLERDVVLPCVVRAAYRSDGRRAIGLAFDIQTERMANDAVALAYGDSARWLFFQERRFRPLPWLSAVRIVARVVIEPVASHFTLLVLPAAKRLRLSMSHVSLTAAIKGVSRHR